jgi:hypothetical protein
MHPSKLISIPLAEELRFRSSSQWGLRCGFSIKMAPGLPDIMALVESQAGRRLATVVGDRWLELAGMIYHSDWFIEEVRFEPRALERLCRPGYESSPNRLIGSVLRRGVRPKIVELELMLMLGLELGRSNLAPVRAGCMGFS